MPPVWFFLAAAAFPIAALLLSILYRRKAGKPMFPKVPAIARYAERWASTPFASSGLLVWVAEDTLHVVPRFPFNLMFLPEIYHLERTIPFSAIREVERRGFCRGKVIVTYGDERRRLRLYVRRPADLLAALPDRRPYRA